MQHEANGTFWHRAMVRVSKDSIGLLGTNRALRYDFSLMESPGTPDPSSAGNNLQATCKGSTPHKAWIESLLGDHTSTQAHSLTE